MKDILKLWCNMRKLRTFQAARKNNLVPITSHAIVMTFSNVSGTFETPCVISYRRQQRLSLQTFALALENMLNISSHFILIIESGCCICFCDLRAAVLELPFYFCNHFVTISAAISLIRFSANNTLYCSSNAPCSLWPPSSWTETSRTCTQSP